MAADWDGSFFSFCINTFIKHILLEGCMAQQIRGAADNIWDYLKVGWKPVRGWCNVL